jgi:hypothetical protein
VFTAMKSRKEWSSLRRDVANEEEEEEEEEEE